VATYKLIQDIEAEDHILGPLTLRQFIFALVTAFLAYLCFICIAKQIYFLLAIFVPPMLLAGFFAFPFGRDQPTETWALAKLQFWFKPRKRLWNQSGVKELVTITAPKKVERVYTDGLSQTEVQSRLKALANTIDSRGWVIKNVNITTYAPNPIAVSNSDRLVNISSVPATLPDGVIVQASDDILDEQNNPIAHQFDNLIEQSTQQRRQELVAQMNEAATAVPVSNPSTAQSWFAAGNGSVTITAPPPQATDSPEEIALAAQIHAKNSSRQASYGNLRTLQPLGTTSRSSSASTQQMPEPPTSAVTAQPHPAILALANNNDLNISTLAREADKAKGSRSRDDEVVISLH
jgi:hypothetical protein